MPTVPHIALLLPLKSPVFAKAADAVQQGFLAAAGKETNGLPVRVYPCKDETLGQWVESSNGKKVWNCACYNYWMLFKKNYTTLF